LIINYTLNSTKGQYNVADWTASQLTKIKSLINKRDRDWAGIVDGDEGSGKTTLASQMAFFVDPTFNQKRLCLTPNDFVEAVNSAEKGQAVVFDEGFTGLSSKRALSKINQLLIELMMEMRKKNLFVLICIPSVFYLEKYIVLHRARALFHTYFSRGKPGQYMIYNKKKLKLLYLFGKRKMSYSFPTVRTKKRFPNIHPIDWETYERRKIANLKKKEKEKEGKLSMKWREHRDYLIYGLYKEYSMSIKEIKGIINAQGVAISKRTVQEIIKNIKTNPKQPETPPRTQEMG
jgi:hypothetical protein